MWQNEFKTILQEEFETKKWNDDGFSLNKFARSTGVSPSTMSELLSGRRDWNLTLERALDIVEKLNLPVTKKNKILLALGQPISSPKTAIEQDKYDFLLNWKKCALVMALDLPKELKTEAKLCERFHITPEELQEMLSSCESLGLIERDSQGSFRRQPHFWTSSDNVPNQILKQHHLNSHELVRQALLAVPTSERDCTAMTFVGSRQKLDEVRKELRAVYERINTIMKGDVTNDEVYQLSISLIPLHETRGSE